jgi:prepilin-type N-terminal cleavage/methylation domain-containing protein
LKNGLAKIAKLRKILSNNHGFSLAEVMVAFSLLAIFLVAFTASQTDMLSDSEHLKIELDTQQFCEEKINDIKLDPPKFNDGLTLSPETGTFEGHESRTIYKYSIEYKRFELPDIFQLTSSGEEGENSSASSNQPNNYMNQVFKQIQENIKNLIWQVSVTVTNSETDHICILTAWVNNPEAKIKIGQ